MKNPGFSWSEISGLDAAFDFILDRFFVIHGRDMKNHNDAPVDLETATRQAAFRAGAH